MTRQRAKQAIVIGAGHNGLACAAMLASRGFGVSVLEALPAPGGMAGTAEFAAGFSVPRCAHLLWAPDARVVEQLRLEAHGFSGAPPVETFSLHPDAPALQLGPANVAGAELSERDVGQYQRFDAMTRRFSRVLERIAERLPPRVGDPSPAAHLELLRTAMAARSLHKADLRELLRVGTSNVHDVLDDYFDNERLKAALAMDGVLGASLGPRSNNSMLNFLHRRMGAGRAAVNPGHGGKRAAGPPVHAFATALLAAAGQAGVQVRTNTAVERILYDGERVNGVVAANGEQLHADVVVSSLDVRTTLEGLVGTTRLEAGVLRRVRAIRCEGRAAKLHLALAGQPAWQGVDPSALSAPGRQLRFLIAPDRRTIEKAFDASKYGEVPTRPTIEFTLPSLADPSLCPDGHQVLSAVVQHAPARPREGLDAARATLLEAALDMLESVSPDLRRRVVATELLMPGDLEQLFGIRGGHWHHGELAVDQYLMLRPMAGFARYASPFTGLWFCGAGTHPGGNVMGTAGYNAAAAILRAAKGKA
jgi:phytoene dehydrogenase-like protein